MRRYTTRERLIAPKEISAKVADGAMTSAARTSPIEQKRGLQVASSSLGALQLRKRPEPHTSTSQKDEIGVIEFIVFIIGVTLLLSPLAIGGLCGVQ